MEIERKYLISNPPMDLSTYEYHKIEQGYLNTRPVVRVRQSDQEFYLTYKGGGKMVREEYNLPLNEEGYLHLREKADGNLITKTRYLIPLTDRPEHQGLTCELDIFEGAFDGLILAEVEFETEEAALSFEAPDWFVQEVTQDRRYHNSFMSKLPLEQIPDFYPEIAQKRGLV